MTQRSLVDLARYLLAGADDLSGGFAPTATAQELLADYERRAAQRTRETILDEMKAGRAPVMPASDDDGIAIVLRMHEAHRRGCARQALRLLIAVLNGMALSGPVYATEFARYERVLADLSREEIILIATVMRHYRNLDLANWEELNLGKFEENIAHELWPDFFDELRRVYSVWASCQRTGLLVQGSNNRKVEDGSAAHVAFPSALLEEIRELASFEDVLRREGEQI